MKDAEWWQFFPVDCYERWSGKVGELAKTAVFSHRLPGVLRGGRGQEMEALQVISTLKPFFPIFVHGFLYQYSAIDPIVGRFRVMVIICYHHQLNFNGKDHDESVNFGFPFWTHNLSSGCCQFSGEVLSEFTP